MPNLTPLATRLEASRDLDCEIAVTIAGFYVKQRPYNDPAYCYVQDGEERAPGGAGDMLVPHYTSSVDAALALVGEKLPGACVLMSITPDKTLVNLHEAPIGVVGKWAPLAEAKTPALALLAALLKALAQSPALVKGEQG